MHCIVIHHELDTLSLWSDMHAIIGVLKDCHDPVGGRDPSRLRASPVRVVLAQGVCGDNHHQYSGLMMTQENGGLLSLRSQGDMDAAILWTDDRRISQFALRDTWIAPSPPPAPLEPASSSRGSAWGASEVPPNSLDACLVPLATQTSLAQLKTDSELRSRAFEAIHT